MRSLLFLAAFLLAPNIRAAAPSGNEMAMNFLRGQVERIERTAAAAMEDFKTPEGRERRRQEALEMFGLSPMPERADLKATITGRHERDGVVVENLHFQSSPGLYVTANFYLPAKVEGKLPTILYLCGHAVVKTNGVSYGNKVGYQHHGEWFAKHGYACLLIDTIQLGEIEGIHHGTNREGMWWWNSRGYSPAGVEAWNSMRALDYLETRPEVDKEKFGVTGRSGGGAYSWSLVALDPRVKVAAPVAGITDLRNHVIDGVVEGHCDCMYFVNTYGWDYPMLAALAAPRPLLIVNTDSDTIFPLDGVARTHRYVSDIYKSLKQSSKLGLVIGPGPHKDTQDIQVPVFRWFNQQLKGEDPLIAEPARKLFAGQELKVFEKIPEDQRVTTVHEWFVPKATSQPKIDTQAEWEKQREIWMTALKEKVFRNWPSTGVSPSKPLENITVQTHVRRRHMLAGGTVDSERVNETRRWLDSSSNVDVISAQGTNANVNLLAASVLSTNRLRLSLTNLPMSLQEINAPDYLNILRFVDIPELLAMAAERHDLSGEGEQFQYAKRLKEKLNWK